MYALSGENYDLTIYVHFFYVCCVSAAVDQESTGRDAGISRKPYQLRHEEWPLGASHPRGVLHALCSGVGTRE